MSARPAAFLDRDGVLNGLVRDPSSGNAESPLRVDNVRLLPGAAGAAKALGNAGFALVCASNQPAAAKGKVTVERLHAVHARVVELLGEEGVRLDASRLCLHHPGGVILELSGPCDCRKPAAGMLLDAARELDLDLSGSWMLGDTDTDVEAGRAAGCRTVLIEHRASAHKRAGRVRADLSAANLPEAVAQLLDQHSRYRM